ncbi:hypothetical protein [Nonomuraea dietziae]|uniref:Putative membrane protein n=1 Tax=Nonomuraea dietziae TaxID=65515 RepID=A0A7W5YC88_9ACTN|nr:hypothetical protein [Nonomuraea dietziae]MBB3732858.1 putative membrane protein [Nonomuraea dietziae]
MKARMIAIMQARWVRLLAAAFIGALVGLAIFELTSAGGRWIFLLTGTVAGVAATAVAQSRAAQLTEVKVTVPQLSELTFLVNNQSRQVAWQLFVETVTRVSVQALDDDEGLIREAMDSLYGLFATTRDALKAGRPSAPVPGGQTVEYFAISMLNKELRPFLSRWHPLLTEWEREHPDEPESAWPDGRQCRDHLRRLQADIAAYAEGFGRLAGIRDPQTLITGMTPQP